MTPKLTTEITRFSLVLGPKRRNNTRAFNTSRIAPLPRRFNGYTFTSSGDPPSRSQSEFTSAIGKLIDKNQPEKPYHAGQLFLHKFFQYRGIVIWPMVCNVCSGDQGNNISQKPYYHVLINQDDWDYNKLYATFAYLQSQNNSREERNLTIIDGMDCVSHDEIIPFIYPPEFLHDNVNNEIEQPDVNRYHLPNEFKPSVIGEGWIARDLPENTKMTKNRPPVEHQLFEALFGVTPLEGCPEGVSFPSKHIPLPSQLSKGITKINPNFDIMRKTWTPLSIYRETTNGVSIDFAVYYLGLFSETSNNVSPSSKHCWQYLMRIHSHLNTDVVIAETQLKCSTQSHTFNLTRNGAHNLNTRLTPQQPIYQFTSVIQLPETNGNVLWGKVVLVRDDGRRRSLEDGQAFEAKIPSARLDVKPPLLTSSKQSEIGDESEQNPIN